MNPALFWLLVIIFQVGSQIFCLGQASGGNPPTYASYIAAITGAHHYPQLID
jgi:hypothetical protein